MKAERIGALWLLGLALLIVGCDEGTEGEGNGDGDETSSGSGDGKVCADWKDAYCEFMQSCAAVSGSACREGLDAQSCRSNADLERCARELSNGCATPSRCTPRDVVDTSGARDQCQAFSRAYCENVLACQPTAYSDLNDCMGIVDLSVGCDDAYAVSATYDRCLGDLNAGGCGEYLPPSCRDVILIQ